MKLQPNAEIKFSGHPTHKEDDDTSYIVPPTVYIYYNLGLTAGGFHTDLKTAKDLRAELDKAIELADAAK